MSAKFDFTIESSVNAVRTSQTSTGKRLHLFCFPEAGGNRSSYQGWRQWLSSDIELHTAEIVDRNNSIPDSNTFIDSLVEKILPQLNSPFAIFGHSMGAIIGYLLTSKLIEENLPLPQHLFISACVPPTHTNEEDIDNFLKSFGQKINFYLYHDLKLLKILIKHNTCVLPIPITVFIGRDDLAIKPVILTNGWTVQTTADYHLHLLAGGHDYLCQSDIKKTVINHVNLYLSKAVESSAADFSVLPAYPSEFLQKKQEKVVNYQFDLTESFHKLNDMLFFFSYSGSVATYNLCWIARIEADDYMQPQFPEMLNLLATWQNNDGSIGATFYPFSDFLNAIMYANTLIKWSVAAEGKYDNFIHAALNHAEKTYPLIAEFDRKTASYGILFQHTGIPSAKLTPNLEIKLLLESGKKYLSDSQLEFFDRVIAPYRKEGWFSHGFYIEPVDDNPIRLSMGEHFPKGFHVSNKAKLIVQKLCGPDNLDIEDSRLNLAFLARYFNLTRDELALSAIKKFLHRPEDGLFVVTRLPDIAFALWYLAEGQIDLKKFFPDHLAYLVDHMRPNGVGAYAGKNFCMDAETSAIVQSILLASKVSSPMATSALENCWNEQMQAYSLANGKYDYMSVGTILYVLHAYLLAGDVTYEQRAVIWQRAVTHLEKKPWLETYHLSPFLNWEKVVSVIGTHINKFPKCTTQVHQQALNTILRHQHKNGGFHSIYFETANPEETALALIALKSASMADTFAAKWPMICSAIRQAESYLQNILKEEGGIKSIKLPEMWTTMETIALPRNAVSAIILGALHKPWQDRDDSFRMNIQQPSLNV